MNKVIFKQKILHLMEEHLTDFDLNISYDKDSRRFFVKFRNILDSRSISFFAHSYSEIYFNLVFFEFGLSYSKQWLRG